MREKIYSTTLENLNILLAENNWQLLGMYQALNIFCLHHFSWSVYSRLLRHVFINLFIICSSGDQNNQTEEILDARQVLPCWATFLVPCLNWWNILQVHSYVSMLRWAHHVNLILYTLSTCTSAQSKAFAVKTLLSAPFPSGLFACSISFRSVILHYTLLPARFWELSCPHHLKISSMFTDTFCVVYQDLFLP